MSKLLAIQLPVQWRKPVLALLCVTVASIVVFFDSWRSMVDIWLSSQTYTHGFLVAPISLWLILSGKDHYAHLQPRPAYWALPFMLACGFVWLAAALTHVLVVGQWALVGMLICAYWALLGTRVYGSILFPLLFLFLMVPFGEDFVPLLMEFTATFVVWMLRLTGMSVYREGLHFTLTSGNWSVVDACSGIRYLIASVTLGAVYAYLNYTSYKKRACFMLVALLLPILANGLRAYMIVMIGHLSSMKLATGVDHLIYGWIFFGLVMLLLFYVGSFWQDPPAVLSATTLNDANDAGYTQVGSLLLVIVVGMAIWPVMAGQMLTRQASHVEIPAAMRNLTSAQTVNPPEWGWEPQFNGVVTDARRYLDDGEGSIAVYFANFGDESQGGELVNSQNQLLQKSSKGWRIVDQAKVPLVWPDQQTMVDQAVLSNGQRDLLVLRWYRVGRINTANAYYAKALQLLKRLKGDASPEVLVVMYAETPHNDYQRVRERLIRIALACCG